MSGALPRRAVLALGANLGDRLATLQAGVDRLVSTTGLVVQAVSAVFETDPVGGPEQPDYLNAVALVASSLTPEDLLLACQAVEASLGRERTVRWGARTLDIDIITIDSLVMDEPHLTLPHPRAHLRAFVLVPWLDVDPQARLIGRGQVATLAAAAQDLAGVRRHLAGGIVVAA